MASKVGLSRDFIVCMGVWLLFGLVFLGTTFPYPSLLNIRSDPAPSGIATISLLYAVAQYVVCWLVLGRPRPRLRGPWWFLAFMAAVGVAWPGAFLLASIDAPAYQALAQRLGPHSPLPNGDPVSVMFYSFLLAQITLCKWARRGGVGVTAEGA
jgi:hypothetical protein